MKRPDRTGSIFQLPHGRWQISVSYYKDDKRFRYCRRFRTREEAEAVLVALNLPGPRTARDRFEEKVTKSDSCWIYTGQIDRLGYGLFNIGQRKVLDRKSVV